MKPRIRKFLAGLLSLGLLLQAASPLSALADSGTSTAPGLTVTAGSATYNLTVDDNGQVTVPTEWTEKATATYPTLPTVSYRADTGFVFSGCFKVDSLSITGNGSEDVTLDGSNFCVAMTASAGDMTGDGLVISKVQNVTIRSSTNYPLVRGSVSITASGNVDIQNNYTSSSDLHACISQNLTVETPGTVTVFSNKAPAVAKKVTVRNASFVDLRANSSYGVIGDSRNEGSAEFDSCGSVAISNIHPYNGGEARAIYSSLAAPLTVTPDTDVVYSAKSSSSGSYTVVEDASACKNYRYFNIDFASASSQCNITVNGLAVTMGNRGQYWRHRPRLYACRRQQPRCRRHADHHQRPWRHADHRGFRRCGAQGGFEPESCCEGRIQPLRFKHRIGRHRRFGRHPQRLHRRSCQRHTY